MSSSWWRSTPAATAAGSSGIVNSTAWGVPATSAQGTTATTMAEAAATNHNSWRRTTSSPRRYRTPRHTTPITTESAHLASLTVQSQASEAYVPSSSVRYGGGRPATCSGASPTSRTNSGAVAATAMATGRQRRDARRPSGSNSSEIGIMVTLTGHAHWKTVASSRTTHSAAPRSASSWASGAASADVAWSAPPAAYIHPSADDGRCHAIRTPQRLKLTPMRMLLTTKASSASAKLEPTAHTPVIAPAAASTATRPSAPARGLLRIAHPLALG